MTQTDRISYMEKLHDKCLAAVSDLERALSGFAAQRAAIEELEAYYTSPEWRADFEADEARLLPPDLKRGVLSEDAIDGLIERYRSLAEQINTCPENEE